jgi:hypothetical protein
MLKTARPTGQSWLTTIKYIANLQPSGTQETKPAKQTLKKKTKPWSKGLSYWVYHIWWPSQISPREPRSATSLRRIPMAPLLEEVAPEPGVGKIIMSIINKHIFIDLYRYRWLTYFRWFKYVQNIVEIIIDWYINNWHIAIFGEQCLSAKVRGPLSEKTCRKTLK